ncbi:MAG TPA: FAD-dependent oxidoreductase [Stellaceae bacterium]|jgi:glycine/D-amino acid oxidase-like deaminating enzyme|nr:FAD-dependent oxidoreductase [Stellaceae bacterium]
MTALDGKDYDFAIIGGGLVGAAIAWGLARLGQRVAVLDQGDRAYRASRGNFALVWVQSKGLGMPQYAAWTKRSSDCWAGLAAELAAGTGIDVAYRRPGGLDLALSETELETRAGKLRCLHSQPNMVRYPYEILERAALERLLPQIGPEVVGASYCPLDGHCNALRLLRALHADMRRRGVAYLPHHEVAAIVPRGDGAFRLVGSFAPVDAGRVVLAAGIANAALAPMVGLTAPVRPQRGQIIVTERLQPFLDYPIATVRQTDEGSVLIGDSAEEAGFDDTVGLDVTATMAARAIRMFPLLAGVNTVRVWAALRVMTEDGFPIYEQSASCPGAFVASCHSGVTLAANHALVLAPMLAAGRLDPTLAPFSGHRFGGGPIGPS